MKGRNCPNCGAVLDERNIKCQYCGALYYDLSTIPVDEPFILTIKDGNRLITARTWLRSVTLETSRMYTPMTISVEIGGYVIREASNDYRFGYKKRP